MKQIAFITDIHLDEPSPEGHLIDPDQQLTTVLTDIAQRGIGEVIFGGDIGSASAHTRFFQALEQFSFNLILGNHDQNDQVRRFFDKGSDANELYYKIQETPYHIFFLDSSSGSISDRQLNWLEEEIRFARDIILYIHHPILPIETPADKAFPLHNRQQLVSLMQEHIGRITVFCGHYHMNDERVFGNIRQICTQSMAFQLNKESSSISVDSSEFGYRIIDISDNAIDVKAIEFLNSKA